MTRLFITLHADSRYRVTESNPNTDTKSTGFTDVASRIVSEGETPATSLLSDSVLISLADSVLSSLCCELPQTMMPMTHPNWAHRSERRSSINSRLDSGSATLLQMYHYTDLCPPYPCCVHLGVDIETAVLLWGKLSMSTCPPQFADSRVNDRNKDRKAISNLTICKLGWTHGHRICPGGVSKQ